MLLAFSGKRIPNGSTKTKTVSRLVILHILAAPPLPPHFLRRRDALRHVDPGVEVAGDEGEEGKLEGVARASRATQKAERRTKAMTSRPTTSWKRPACSLREKGEKVFASHLRAPHSHPSPGNDLKDVRRVGKGSRQRTMSRQILSPLT